MMEWRTRFSKKSAFTLAEVLFTLGIIGVVAVIVLHTVKVTQTAQYPTMRAVFKNDIAQAMATLNIEHNLAQISDTNELVSELNNYYDMTHTCNASECFGAAYKDAAGDPVTLKNYDYTFQAPNGTTVSLSYVNGGSISPYAADNSIINPGQNSYERSNAALNFVTGVYDVNGAKGPNKIGEDVGFIMPAYALDKRKGEYLTYASDGSIVVKKSTKLAGGIGSILPGSGSSSSSNGSGTSNDSSSGTVVVDANGVFVAKSASVTACANYNENMLLDDYGYCSVCSLTNAACEAQGKKLNKANCACEFGVGCPKNQVQNAETGECSCRANLACGLYTRDKDAQGNSIMDPNSCSCRCELGAASKCILNGGIWDSTTCSCGCGQEDDNETVVPNGQTGTAAYHCSTKYKGYATAYSDRKNYCECECKSTSEITSQIAVNANNASQYTGITQADSNLNNKCFTCKSSSSNYTSVNKDEDKGYCVPSCKNLNYTDANKNFYRQSNLVDATKANSCAPECVLTDAYCNKYNNFYSSCSILDEASSCGIGNFPGHNCSPARYRANTSTCRCELVQQSNSWPSGSLSGAFNGKCGVWYGYNCSYTRHTLSSNPNENNPINSTRDSSYAYVTESCSSWADPILMILPYSENVSTTPTTVDKAVSVKIAKNDTEKTPMSWLKPQSSTPVFYFLTKGSSFDSFQGDLFSDIEYDNGVVELIALYDTNKDGVVNDLDDEFSTLRLWGDANGNAVAETSEISTLSDHNITEIYGKTYLTSGDSGAIEGSDTAITGIQGCFKAAKEEVSTAEVQSTDKVWLKRENDGKEIKWCRTRIIQEKQLKPQPEPEPEPEATIEAAEATVSETDSNEGEVVTEGEGTTENESGETASPSDESATNEGKTEQAEEPAAPAEPEYIMVDKEIKECFVLTSATSSEHPYGPGCTYSPAYVLYEVDGVIQPGYLYAKPSTTIDGKPVERYVETNGKTFREKVFTLIDILFKSPAFESQQSNYD